MAVHQLLQDLWERELVNFVNPIIVLGDTITWRSPTPLERFVDFADYPTIRTYRRWAEAGEYSARFSDGALLQIRYRVAKGQISAHRLAYVPCPYRIDQKDQDDLEKNVPMSEVLDCYANNPHDDITMQTAIRFDFDPGAAAEGHPSTHLTLNVASCRIACESPMAPAAFVRFVFQNFYRDCWTQHIAFFEALPQDDMPSTVTDDERGHPHIAWRSTR
ncbi:DUF2290 domain-containing protein [Ferrimicrobium sp.]|uniref:DUF2290 domain-containing protein n=1 Tax=Ferrimicrobium sp. TaxID=2926050 RepID=UPI00263400FB|nr:DUF2290 domain-containing protein [Ferrimicrobium sp.]